MKMLERSFERVLFTSRWLLAPFYIGLVIAVILLLIKFCSEIVHLVTHIFTISESELVIHILTLIDVSLIANLLIIITFSGYENFVSKLDVEQHEDKPAWLGKVGFTGLKLKVIGSIMTISAVELLKVFINIQAYDDTELMWRVIIHVVFVFSGVLFALTDKLAPGNH